MNEDLLAAIITREEFDEFVELYDEFERPIYNIGDPRFDRAETAFRRRLDELIHHIVTHDPSVTEATARRGLILRARRQLKIRNKPADC